jgi:hypothetical protein
MWSVGIEAPQGPGFCWDFLLLGYMRDIGCTVARVAGCSQAQMGPDDEHMCYFNFR